MTWITTTVKMAIAAFVMVSIAGFPMMAVGSNYAADARGTSRGENAAAPGYRSINGIAGLYAQEYEKKTFSISSCAQSEGCIAKPANSEVLVNGKSTSFATYTVAEDVYFKLRDLAMVLSQTDRRFDISWDGENNEVRMFSRTAYTGGGSENFRMSAVEKSYATPSSAMFYLDGRRINLPAYTIGDSNYVRLSDLASFLKFKAVWIDALERAEIDVNPDKIYYSENTGLWDEPVTGVKSFLRADIDGDGSNETAEIVVSEDEDQKWTLVYKDGAEETSVGIFKDNEYGYAISIAAGRLIGDNNIDFLVASNLMSMPFGGSNYELYTLKEGVFEKIDISGITAGTIFEVIVDESQKTAVLSSYEAEKSVPLSDMELSDYQLYGNEFCQNFFIEMEFQRADGEACCDLITTEVIAAVLPLDLTYLHTTYRYIDGVWHVQKVELYDHEEEIGGDQANEAGSNCLQSCRAGQSREE